MRVSGRIGETGASYALNVGSTPTARSNVSRMVLGVSSLTPARHLPVVCKAFAWSNVYAHKSVGMNARATTEW